jgi:hypothetical protein
MPEMIAHKALHDECGVSSPTGRRRTVLFLHVGLHKTGTTYLQSEVFPRWSGVRYLRNLTIETFLRIPANSVCLASREGFSGGVIAPQSEKLMFLKQLNHMFPDARILISFRQHGSYVNAIYSQYLRYGGTATLAEFFDLDGNSGIVKREDLLFRVYVEKIQEYWGTLPFVFLLSELKEDKSRLLADLGAYFGCEPPDLCSISTKPKNVSLGHTQAEVLRRINQWFRVQLHPDGSTRPYRFLRRLRLDPPRLCQRWSGLIRSRPLMDPDMARQIDEYYRDDWAYLEDKAKSRRSILGAS